MDLVLLSFLENTIAAPRKVVPVAAITGGSAGDAFSGTETAFASCYCPGHGIRPAARPLSCCHTHWHPDGHPMVATIPVLPPSISIHLLSDALMHESFRCVCDMSRESFVQLSCLNCKFKGRKNGVSYSAMMRISIPTSSNFL